MQYKIKWYISLSLFYLKNTDLCITTYYYLNKNINCIFVTLMTKNQNNILYSVSIDSSIDSIIETSVIPYYKPILASNARARTIISGYHVSL